MYGEKAKDALNARYSIRKTLGEYPPWHGYSVADSLSEREYLLFSVDTPPGVSLSIEDLRMRDYLFSRSGKLAPAVISLQQANGSLTFLLPYADIKPLVNALPRMKPDEAAEIMRTIMAYVLARIGEGLCFCNLNLESFYMAHDKPGILPVAYLLPGDCLRRMSADPPGLMSVPGAPFGDLRALGNVLSIFAPYLDHETAGRIKRLAVRLQSLARETTAAEFRSVLDELAGCAGEALPQGHFFPARLFQTPPPSAPVRAMKHAALKAREGEKQIVIVTGVRGGGKTHFLEFIAHRLMTEWGFRHGGIAGDLALYQDPADRETGYSHDFVIVDDHGDEPLLACHVVDCVCQAIERCNLVVLSGSADAPLLARHVREGVSKRAIEIREIELPAPGRRRDDRELGALGSGFLDALSGEERSVLGFLAVFGFEVPLSFLLGIFAPEENGIYTALQNLVARGLVKSRVETSSLAGGNLAIVYSPASGSAAREVLRNLPPERTESIHRSIARLLAEMRNAPSLYTFFHLVRSGAREEAALKGLEILRSFMKRKKLAALNCFNASYMDEKLDRALPVDTRFNLYLELGNHFSLTGSMERAECFFHRCREGIAREEEPARFRNLAVEAARRESEILEKRGEFLKAEKLLEKALDTHGEKLLSSERAKLYNDIAWIHYRLGAFDRSWEHCLVVHKLLDEKQNPAEIAQAYNLMGTINWNRSRYDDAILCYKRCLALREECGDEIGIAASYNNLGLVYRSLGLVAEALECFTKSMEIKKRHENLPGLAAAHLNLALVYLDLEQIKDAERSCITASRLAEEIGNQQLLAESYGTMGEIWFLQGNYEKAQSCYAKDLHLCDKTKSLRERAVVYRKLGDLNFALGKLPETKELLAQARSLNQKIGSRLETALLNLLEGKILLAEGKREDGRYKLEGASLELSLLGKKNAASAVAADIGNLYLEEGNEPLAREYLLRAMSLVAGGEQAPQQARLLQDALEARSPLSRDQIVSDSDRFRALCRLASLMRTARDQETLRATIVETARRITAMDRAAFLTKAEGHDSFRIAAASGAFTAGSMLADRNIGAVLSMALRLGYPLDVSRTTIPEGKVPPEFLEEHPRLICVPLRIQGEAVDFLYLDSTRSSARTTDEDHSLLLFFSQEAAAALEKMLLVERIDHLEKSRSVVKSAIARPKEHVTFQDLIGTSAPMRHIYELVEGIKDMDTTVLLTGSNGTGKDLIAKTIHYGGCRAERPFVSLNCSAIPDELLESELFGHEKGAFTGAHKQRIGHFESANGGTIFLNEIGDMPLRLQPKLLHVLENQKFYRLGGTITISTNVRIITATNKDLLGLVSEGRFREDLYYRVNIFPIRVPDLKERAEDIEPLCNHFLSTFCRLYGIPQKKISAEAMSLFISYDWPGNVRELENLINRIIIISKKETILPEDLPDCILKRPESARAESRATIEETIDTLLANVELSTGDPILPRIEGMIVSKVVEKIGDKTKAAAVLGISKPTVYAKLKKYGKNKGS
ncbi:MAG: sigma 54-interacting transcriptional regulator [Candidatus Krumholzibacteriia bacterium]